ncbi:MAG: sulfite reductase (NADPH) hemoprotein beta-component [Candidatus Azotimanducaceae bacterium]|jgi:sulfite reductase (NADPH) hemoprotein beta-component
MYQYRPEDQSLVNERVAQFRDQTERYLAGELSEDEFRPLRLMNGLYIQTHAPMLRVAVPYGLLSSKQMHMLADISRKYDRNYGHLTTRQNMQFNWLALKDVPDVLADLAGVEMHSIQTSGNCIRNTSSDQLAGAAEDELEDPRPYCEMIRQWSTLHPEFSFLPRKFKIAVSGSRNDRAATQVHDIGIQLIEHPETGEVGFKILVGGGLGRTPVIGKVIKEYLPKKFLLSYLEAILRIYNLAGRRDNKYKARIKILVNSVGIEEFTKQVEEEWSHLREGSLLIDDASITDMQNYFRPFDYLSISDDDVQKNLKDKLEASPAFAIWYRQNTQAHKVSGYRVVTISVKAPGEAPGDLTDKQMDGVAQLAEAHSFGQLRITHEQNLVLADVPLNELHVLWKGLVSLDLATPNIGTLTDMICCPGLDFCSLANAGSIPIAKQINEKFDDLDYLYDIGEIKVKMSGCMNACGHHHVGHIGILGVDKKGEEWYQITIGGSAEEDASLGKIIGPSVSKERVAETIQTLLTTYVALRAEEESFLQSVRRLGVAPFKEAVYG